MGIKFVLFLRGEIKQQIQLKYSSHLVIQSTIQQISQADHLVASEDVAGVKQATLEGFSSHAGVTR